MKCSNLSKIFLSVLFATQLYSSNVFAKKIIDGSNPNNKLNITTISRELTDEEALEYINEEQLEVDIEKSTFGSNYGMGNNNFGFGEQIPAGKLGIAFMVVDKLMAVGERLAPLIIKGRPAGTDNSMNAVSVLPLGLTTDKGIYVMDNWSFPVTKYFEIKFVRFGITLAAFDYGVTYQHSGRYGGKGSYLTGIRVSAKKIYSSWGWDLSASSKLLNISNVGKGKIVAAATLEMQYTLSNVFNHLMNSKQIFVTGDNRIKED